MKILLATYDYPPDLGGVAAYLGGLFGTLPKGSVTVLKLRLPAGRFGWLFQLPKLWLAARRADVVAVSHVLPLGTAAALLGKPYAVIVHGLDLRAAAARPRKKRLAARVLSGAELVVANSRATAQELAAFGLDPASALVLTPCPDVALEADGAEALGGKSGLEGRKVLLAVGRLVPRKGFDRLIRLLPELRRACGDVVLVIAGAGPEEAHLREEAARSPAGPYVRFVIAPDRARLASLYRAADVFALPVRASKDDFEGFGIVFLEAALFGLPSVGTRVDGVLEAVEDGVTGLLADPESEDDLREKIEKLLSDPDAAARLGQAGRARVLSGFRWDERAARFIERLA